MIIIIIDKKIIAKKRTCMRAGGIKIEPIDELILSKVLKGKSKQ